MVTLNNARPSALNFCCACKGEGRVYADHGVLDCLYISSDEKDELWDACIEAWENGDDLCEDSQPTIDHNCGDIKIPADHSSNSDMESQYHHRQDDCEEELTADECGHGIEYHSESGSGNIYDHKENNEKPMVDYLLHDKNAMLVRDRICRICRGEGRYGYNHCFIQCGSMASADKQELLESCSSEFVGTEFFVDIYETDVIIYENHPESPYKTCRLCIAEGRNHEHSLTACEYVSAAEKQEISIIFQEKLGNDIDKKLTASKYEIAIDNQIINMEEYDHINIENDGMCHEFDESVNNNFGHESDQQRECVYDHECDQYNHGLDEESDNGGYSHKFDKGESTNRSYENVEERVSDGQRHQYIGKEVEDVSNDVQYMKNSEDKAIKQQCMMYACSDGVSQEDCKEVCDGCGHENLDEDRDHRISCRDRFAESNCDDSCKGFVDADTDVSCFELDEKLYGIASNDSRSSAGNNKLHPPGITTDHREMSQNVCSAVTFLASVLPQMHQPLTKARVTVGDNTHLPSFQDSLRNENALHCVTSAIKMNSTSKQTGHETDTPSHSGGDQWQMDVACVQRNIQFNHTASNKDTDDCINSSTVKVYCTDGGTRHIRCTDGSSQHVLCTNGGTQHVHRTDGGTQQVHRTDGGTQHVHRTDGGTQHIHRTEGGTWHIRYNHGSNGLSCYFDDCYKHERRTDSYTAQLNDYYEDWQQNYSIDSSIEQYSKDDRCTGGGMCRIVSGLVIHRKTIVIAAG